MGSIGQESDLGILGDGEQFVASGLRDGDLKQQNRVRIFFYIVDRKYLAVLVHNRIKDGDRFTVLVGHVNGRKFALVVHGMNAATGLERYPHVILVRELVAHGRRQS